MRNRSTSPARTLESSLARLLPALFILVSLLWMGLQAAPTALAGAGKPPESSPTFLNSLGLASFDGKVTPSRKVVLAWETGNEVNIIGFNVWRRQRGKADWIKLNSSVISAKNPGQITGNQYHFRDKTVKLGKGYFYQLEVLSFDGYSAWSEQVKLKIR